MNTMPNLDMTVRNEEDRNTDEINLNRAIYLLQHGSLETNAMFLLNYAYCVRVSNLKSKTCLVVVSYQVK